MIDNQPFERFKAFQTAVSHLEKGDTMGERIGRIGRIRTDFFSFLRISKHTHPKKNPFVSARSAQSVLPSYHPFPNEKLLPSKRLIVKFYLPPFSAKTEILPPAGVAFTISTPMEPTKPGITVGRPSTIATYCLPSTS
jgi:hypothetical protein